MSYKYFDGIILSPNAEDDIDKELMETAIKTVFSVDDLMKEFRISDSLYAILNLARRSNKYIDETTPWVLAKDEDKKDRLATVLYNLLESIRFIAVLLSPFLPDTSKEIFRQLNTTETTYDSINSFGALNVNEKLNPAQPLFNRIDAEKLIEEIQKNNVAEEEKIELQPEISIDDFMKIELRAAKVISCEPVKKSDKLLCLQLDDGMGGRQVVSGIAQWYKPDDLVGKKVTIVANLKPVKLRGVMSNGMICCSEMADGSVKVNFLDDDVPCGSKIR